MKKIVNRFWEFLMLFIAISLGFFVENYREVLVDRQKEKEIIASFINDLETDIQELDIVIQRRETREVRIDSIIHILNNGLQDDYGKDPEMNRCFFYPGVEANDDNDGLFEQPICNGFCQNHARLIAAGKKKQKANAKVGNDQSSKRTMTS